MAQVVAAGPVCHESAGVKTAGTSLELVEGIGRAVRQLVDVAETTYTCVGSRGCKSGETPSYTTWTVNVGYSERGTGGRLGCMAGAISLERRGNEGICAIYALQEI